MSMSKKIFAVVALLVAVAVIISAVSIVSIGSLNENTIALAEQAERGVQMIIIDRATQKRQAATLRTIINTDPARLAAVIKDMYEPTSAEFAEAVAAYKANVPGDADEEMKSRTGILQGLWDAFVKETDATVELAKLNHHTLATAKVYDMANFYNQINQNLADIIGAVPDDAPPEMLRVRRGLLEARVDLAYYRFSTVQLIAAEGEERIKQYSGNMKNYMEKLISGTKGASGLPGDLGRKAREMAAELNDKAIPSMNEILVLGSRDTNAEALENYRERVIPALDALSTASEQYINSSAKNRAASKALAEQLGSRADMATIFVAGIGILLGVFLAYFIISRITRQLNQIIDELGESSHQVAEAATMISASSSKLAEGATEQAASLEETSASLEEMASMTRKNADNANLTSTSTTHTVKLIDEGTKAVGNMSTAMTEISDSAGKISQIIKTIEEISFQTNLLALNAAVEAARAGEAGKGFAVVADEVRNLAQRAAQAARDTSELIEGTVTRVKNGSEVAAQLEAGFTEIDSGAKQVGTLITEITTATNEQAQGVDQINTAVGQMDKVTQANAANSEECASASEELSAQAEALQGMVNSLVALVTGKAGHSAAPPRRAAPKPAAAAKKPAPKRLAAPAKAAKHEDPIPMGGGDDFQDF